MGKGRRKKTEEEKERVNRRGEQLRLISPTCESGGRRPLPPPASLKQRKGRERKGKEERKGNKKEKEER